MRFIYIAHPIYAPNIAGIQENLSDLRRIIKHINLTFPNIVPLCSYYADVVSLDDTIPEQRARGIKNNTAILRRGNIAAVWLTGPFISGGMQSEKNLALSLGIPVKNYIGHF